ncbi:beta-lactamase/transpeptidase-like protein [Thozetella sp. PMI_491]|nr:beta-lactamase/transpeptidase-like protein [Thozetella sp. PMI_491]
MRASRALAILDGVASAAAKSSHCPPLGPVLPAPKAPSSNAAVAQAIQVFGDTFNGITRSLNYSAVSIGVQSIHEDKPLLELFYTPPNLSDQGGVKTVDADTIYRLGSLSKLFPALAALQVPGASFEDPVTKYLPQLRDLKKEQEVNNDITTVDWELVTLGGLASHLSGIGTDYPVDIASFLGSLGTMLGLPNITDPSILPNCAGLLDLPPCNASDLYEDFGRRPPVYAPYTTPVYSNVGYSILGLAVAAASNMTFADFVQKNILDVVSMNSTLFTVPDASKGFIGVNETWWDASIGVEVPAGGMFSTLTDMLAFGTSILKNKLLTPAQTRKWLKPHVSTSSVGMAIGAPWEILRSDSVTMDGRFIEFYTKSGDMGFYHNQFILVPDYDLVITVLTSGAESSPQFSESVMSKVIKGLIPAIEQAGKDEAAVAQAGTYTDEATNSTITLALDDGPGLAIEKWVVRGTDIFSNYFSYSLSGPPDPAPPVTARLYPTNLAAGNQTAWRAVFEVGTSESLAFEDADMIYPRASCVTWAMQDRLVWVYKGLDEFIFTQDSLVEPSASSVLLLGFQVSLERSQE